MYLADAKKFLGEIVQIDGSLHNMGSGYVNWQPGDLDVTLDGQFTAEDLEAIVTWMRQEHQ